MRAEYGYTTDTFKKFQTDLASIKNLLGDLFDFELALVKSTQSKPTSFTSTGPFKALRAAMATRWERLNNQSGYPELVPKLC